MGMKVKTTFHPRGNAVICRLIQLDKDKETGLYLPQVSQEGKQHVVVAVGPDVKGLEPGDKVLAMGTFRVDWDFLPGFRDLFIIRENLCLKFTEEFTYEGDEE